MYFVFNPEKIVKKQNIIALHYAVFIDFSVKIHRYICRFSLEAAYSYCYSLQWIKHVKEVATMTPIPSPEDKILTFYVHPEIDTYVSKGTLYVHYACTFYLYAHYTHIALDVTWPNILPKS